MVSEFIKALFDRTITIGYKLFIGFLLFIGIVVFDNYMGISYFTDAKNKVSVLKESSELLSNSNIDSVTKRKIVQLQVEVINRENFVSQTWKRLAKRSKMPIPDYNRVLFYISSSWILILMAISALLFKGKNFYYRLAIALLCVFLTPVFYFGFGLIPKINGDWIFNYIVNFILHLIIIVLLGAFLWKRVKNTDEVRLFGNIGNK